jgi:hypothetical protein
MAQSWLYCSVFCCQQTFENLLKRLEAELGDEQSGFIEGEPREWELLPLPEGFFIVGIDGGYGRNGWDKQHNSLIGKPLV